MMIDGQAPRLSALNTKITSILSSSLANIEIRDALEALDTRKIQNTPATRRNLRLDLQQDVITSNAEIISDFGIVAAQLSNVGTALSKLQQTVAEMRRHVSAAKLETAPMLEEAEVLLTKQREVTTKKQLLQAFNAHFVLSEDELLFLTSTADPVDDSFFVALVKAKKIHQDSQVLLSSENQRLGLEILDASSKNLNAAFQKLYRWVQREFKSLDLENPQLNASLRRGVRVLAERPALFQNCLDTFAEAREKTLLDAFYAALTGSSAPAAGAQRPIEFSMHDPLRYVGDMMAWLHSTAVSEREALEGLFVSEGDEIARSIKAGLESEPWSRSEEEQHKTFDGRKTLGHLIDRGLAGASQVFRQRVDQVVQNHDDPVLAYKVANLIAFYRNIFARLVDSTEFLGTMDQMRANALNQFKTFVRVQLTSASTDASVPYNFSTPDFLEDALEQLRALLTSYETSAASSAASDEAFNLIIDEALTPFIIICSDLASTVPLPGSSFFNINCLQTCQTTLHSFRNIAQPVIINNDASINEHITLLSEWTQSYLLEQSGLSVLVEEIREVRDIADSSAALQALLASPTFSEDSLHELAQRLDAFLPSAIIDANEQLRYLRDKVLLGQVISRGADGFKAAFEQFVEWLERIDESGLRKIDEVPEDAEEYGAMPLRYIYPRTIEEVGILLS